MTEKLTLDTRELDDQLATYVDRLLDNDTVNAADLDHQDPTLLELQETALSLKQAFGNEPPSKIVAQRIKTVLKHEWHKNARAVSHKPTWMHRLRSWQATLNSGSNRWLSFGMAVSALVVVFVVIVLFSSVSPNPDLLGAANGQSGPLPVLFAIGLAIIVAIWLVRKK
jgi:hypothetical protein